MGLHPALYSVWEETDETRDYLFFTCPYSFTVWIDLIGFLLGSRVNPDWSITLVSLLSTHRNEIDICLLKLAFQVTVHILWRERNSRRHHGNHPSAAHMVCFIDKTIKNMSSSSLRHRKPAFYNNMMPRWPGYQKKKNDGLARPSGHKLVFFYVSSYRQCSFLKA